MHRLRALRFISALRHPDLLRSLDYDDDIQQSLIHPHNRWQAAIQELCSPRSIDRTLDPAGESTGPFDTSGDYPHITEQAGTGQVGKKPGAWRRICNAWTPWTDAKAGWRIVTGSLINLLLPCCLLGIVAQHANWGPTTVFVLNLLGIVPLALLLGEVTEDLALRLGPVVGGLVNATFGNVVELILAIAALTQGLLVVVYTSLVGSILSNLLLVMGCSFLAGGFKHKTQSFNMTITKANNALLFLACAGLIIPTAAHLTNEIDQKSELLLLSRLLAIVLLFTYMCYLVFNLYTHCDIINCQPEGDVEGQQEAEDRPTLSLVGGFLYLGCITAVVAVCSEFLTGAIEHVSKASGLSQAFLGLVVLPIAGNACEHITAVMVAMHNKMDLAVGVAVGSSIQIAMLVIPVITILGWILKQPFSLDMDPFATIVVTVSVIHANLVMDDASSNWLMGILLLATYLVVAIVYALNK